MHPVSLKLAYVAGRNRALGLVLKRAAEDFTQQPPDDASAAIPYGYGADARMRDAEPCSPGEERPAGKMNSSDSFALFAQSDNTEQTVSGDKERQTPPGSIADRPVHWSGNSSLEAGDAASRVTSIPTPRFGGV